MPASLIALASTVALALAPAPDAAATLKAQTQALYDAITVADPKVWDRYLDPEVIYVDEAGVRQTKASMLDQVTPLPKGISGSIVVTEFEARFHGNVAVTTHVEDEHEDYFGHRLHAQYRTTDTWLLEDGGWKLIQSHAYASLLDPPAITLPAARLDEYGGTYRLTPEIAYVIRRKGSGLTGERTGRKPQPLSIEASDVMFVAGQPRSRKVFLRNETGRITGFADRREGRDVVWTRDP